MMDEKNIDFKKAALCLIWKQIIRPKGAIETVNKNLYQ